MGYKNPALTEIYSEFQFENGTFGPAQFLPLLPLFAELGFAAVEMQAATEVKGLDIGKPSPQLVAKILLWSGEEERRKLIQVSQDNLTVNSPGKYEGWETFLELIRTLLRIVERSGISISTLSTVSLNTIDEIHVEDPEFSIGKYLNCGGPRIPSVFHEVAEPVDMTLGRGILSMNGFNRQLRVAVRTEGPNQRILLTSIFKNRLDGRAPLEVLEMLHDESTASFKSLVSPTTENEVMGGMK